MIKKVWFPAEMLSPVGLVAQEQTMAGLGKLVVLAGPNGAGKSRYLRVLQEVVGEVQQALQEEVGYESLIPEAERQLPAEVARGIPRRILNMIDPRTSLAHVRQTRGFKMRRQQGLTNFGSEKFIELTYNVSKTGIQLAESIAPQDAVTLAKSNFQPGFWSAHMSMHAYFTEVARALWSGGDVRMREQPNVTGEAAKAAEFNFILNILVGGSVTPVLDENHLITPLFRGRRFNPVELSNGEAVLITWAIILHRQKDQLADSIIIVDEPENHLHPDACIKSLRALRDQILLGPHGQIWLATHSVQLIAFAGMDAVWLVDGGRVEYAGNKVDKVVERLLGGKDGRDQLRVFLADADALGFYKFAAECLVDPMVATTKADDPQEAQFVKLVRERSEQGQPLRLLDFGAGKGRLASALREARSNIDDESAVVRLAYYAYNGAQSAPEEVAECHRRVDELCAVRGVRAEYMEDLRVLQLETAPRMDLVVLCNVLHEIPVDRWVGAFRDIARVLSTTGLLLIMEDQHMGVGELPSAHGFVVLDAIEIAAVFGAKYGEEVRALPAARSGRLTQIEISALVLSNANGDRIAAALAMVQMRARKEIARLRDGDDRSFQAGRLHSYYSMLHMNAMLAQKAFA